MQEVCISYHHKREDRVPELRNGRTDCDFRV